jgi:hypothetical protein
MWLCALVSDTSALFWVCAVMLGERGFELVVRFPSGCVAKINIPWPWVCAAYTTELLCVGNFTLHDIAFQKPWGKERPNCQIIVPQPCVRSQYRSRVWDHSTAAVCEIIVPQQWVRSQYPRSRSQSRGIYLPQPCVPRSSQYRSRVWVHSTAAVCEIIVPQPCVSHAS